MKRKMVFAWFMSLALVCFVAASAQAATVTFDFQGVGSGSNDLRDYMRGLLGSTYLDTNDLKSNPAASSLFASDSVWVQPGADGTVDFDNRSAGASTYKIESVSLRWGVYDETSGIDFGLDVFNDVTGNWINNVYSNNNGEDTTGLTGVITFDSAWQVTRLRIHDNGTHDVGMDDLTIVDNRPDTGNGTAPVPEPGTMILLGSGLVGLAGWGRKKLRK